MCDAVDQEVSCYLGEIPHEIHKGSRGFIPHSWRNLDYVAPNKGRSKKETNDKMQEIADKAVKPPLPLTPYAGTSGWSGSETSKARALRNDASGVTAASQRTVLEYVTRGGIFGATVAEIREPVTDMHHGTTSGALTTLHKGGYLARLTESRNRCAIYVLPEFVNGRPTVAAKNATPDPEPPPAGLRHFE